MNKKVILLILDGWGIETRPEASAIYQANTPFIDTCYKCYPNSRLEASGLAVGLPEGQMGNSEVGHTNIGAGRVVYQDLVKLNRAAANGSMAKNKTLAAVLNYAKKENKTLHLIGLVSDGGIHSHIQHLKALCEAAAAKGLTDVKIHAFTDGRDTDPKSGAGFVSDLQRHLDKTVGKIASITGRYYAMDRDQRWERIKTAYDAMVHGRGARTQDIQAAIQDSYTQGVTDEFIKPIIQTDTSGQPIGVIAPHDAVVCFNFRTDRGRQITEALSQRDFPEWAMKKLPLSYATMTNYSDHFNISVNALYEKEHLVNTLGETLEQAGKKQVRIAETEKYPHVTFFFSGGREEAFYGERQILCPSPKVATYDLQPEMSAESIRDNIIKEMKEGIADFICLNFANPDMVGHTGVFKAAIKACEVVDSCTQSVVHAAQTYGYSPVIIADHGNADLIVNADGTPNTAHTTNLVPCIFADPDIKAPVKDGKLSDIAPTILTMMGIAIPKEMTGEILISHANRPETAKVIPTKSE